VKDKLPALLGREDAKFLGVLKVGLSACTPHTETLSKVCTKGPLSYLKDFELTVPVNPEIKPVIQPLRRVPYALKSQVDSKLQQLLNNDVIEPVNSASQ